MRRVALLLGCGLFCGLWCGPVAAQTFRRVTDVSELEAGAHYVLAGYSRIYADSVYVMAAQETTGTKTTSRKGRLAHMDENGRIRVEDGGTAVFELQQEGTAYAFRDLALNACLAYTVKQVSNATTSLFTLTDEELAQMPDKSKEKYCKTFVIEPLSASSRLPMTRLYTAEKVYYSTSSRQAFGMMVDGYGGSFKLYKTNSGDSLYIYKEVEPPSVEVGAGEDWTFRGDWLGDSLFAMDFSKAQRIDFTEMTLPQGAGTMSADRLPGKYVWTYVRKGQASRLPEGWPNVIEIERKDAEVAGEAVTPIVGCDSCRLGPKYAFSVPQGTGIRWERTVYEDGGWYTIGLPFAVERTTWGTSDGETAELERLSFEEMSADGAVFRRVETGEPWKAGMPCLWRPTGEQADDVLCFCASEAVVMTETEGWPQNDGFFATFSRRDITEETAEPLYLLNPEGTCFVRLTAGSWMDPCRGFLRCAAAGEKSTVRLIGLDALGMESVRKGGKAVPVYSITGVRQGVLKQGEKLPADWPAGLYVTPGGKLLKR